MTPAPFMDAFLPGLPVRRLHPLPKCRAPPRPAGSPPLPSGGMLSLPKQNCWEVAMRGRWILGRWILGRWTTILIGALVALPLAAQAQTFPGADWQRKTPAEAGINPQLLKDAVDFA